MKRKIKPPRQFRTISELYSWFNTPGPYHPLISVLNLADITVDNSGMALAYDFYQISLKKNFEGKLRYGQRYYDFDKGVMTFLAPQQVMILDEDSPRCPEGYSLLVHPDFFRGYPLAEKIKEYGFFSYAVHEALHLSDQEEQMIIQMMQLMGTELSKPIDRFTQDVVVSYVELLLNYCNRFYGRQFITRKPMNDEVLLKLEMLLTEYFKDDITDNEGSIVQYLAAQLNLSPNYLNDLLKSLTGQTTQQHIQQKLIDRAKDILSNTSLSVSEVAYKLGFKYPQSFNRLFKSKTNQSPLAYRQSIN
jgi:AraC family transcriptional regulator, transcriptional activator of pobA